MFCPRQNYLVFGFSTNLLFLSCNIFFGIILTKVSRVSQKYFLWLENFSSANIAFIDFSQGSFVLPFLNQFSLHKQNISHTTYFHSSKPAPISFSPLSVADHLIWRSEDCTPHSSLKYIQVVFKLCFCFFQLQTTHQLKK